MTFLLPPGIKGLNPLLEFFFYLMDALNTPGNVHIGSKRRITQPYGSVTIQKNEFYGRKKYLHLNDNNNLDPNG